MARPERKSLDTPDETHSFPRGHCDVVAIGPFELAKSVLEPGWRWSTCVGPTAGTERCETSHQGYVLSGHLCLAAADGTEVEAAPGDAFVAPPGHDAWVVGNEPCVLLTFVAHVPTYALPLVVHAPPAETEERRAFAHATANPPLLPRAR
jgi:mannose-6-phosphate isomerase-like protein (cupin superfamily)